MKPSVYIESSVVSYLTARISRNLIVAAHQQITNDWWETALPHYNAFVSPIVLEEVSKGDQHAIQLRLEKISDYSVLEIVPDVYELAEVYFADLEIPNKARADAYHLALATWHGIDYLVSWNCTHIVNGRIRMKIEEINSKKGIRTGYLHTRRTNGGLKCMKIL